MNWKQRSGEQELLDEPGHSFADIRQNMQELNTINHWLGGHAITISGFRRLARSGSRFTICEIGCGGGDNLSVIYHWAKKRGISVNCIGIDINEDCVSFARQQFPQAEYLIGDYRKVNLPDQPDIIFSSLFCHHFSDTELLDQLKWMEVNARLGFFINDLHRHRVAYASIKFLTAVFSSSRLVKHDAPVSVKRGFSRIDWEQLLKQAGFTQAGIQWKWAFRWMITVVKKTHEE
jgi:2-polyprenyl-3-methyl-5-hydroxy-6-metoxy-1,4-benzoquinol methylase